MWQIFRERTIECFVATIHEFSLPSESLLALDLCARLSTGRPFPDDQPGTGIANAIVLNAEDSAQDTTRPRLQALGANLERVFVPLQTDHDSAELFRLPGGIPQLDSALKRTQARLVVFDPLVAFLDPSISANSDQVVAARFQRAKAQEIGTLKTCRHQMQSFMSTPPLPPRPSAATIMVKLGLIPDDWQAAVLETPCPRLLLNCCRQAGKSTVVALLGLVEALSVPGTRVILLSRSHRQSRELFRIVIEFYRRLGSPLEERRTAQELQLTNLARK